MAQRVTKPTADTVTIVLDASAPADVVELGDGATIRRGSRAVVRASTWTAAQEWLDRRGLAAHITVEE